MREARLIPPKPRLPAFLMLLLTFGDAHPGVRVEFIIVPRVQLFVNRLFAQKILVLAPKFVLDD